MVGDKLPGLLRVRAIRPVEVQVSFVYLFKVVFKFLNAHAMVLDAGDGPQHARMDVECCRFGGSRISSGLLSYLDRLVERPDHPPVKLEQLTVDAGVEAAFSQRDGQAGASSSMASDYGT